jgi:predicted GIY-YIG superfamily endonuclease
MMAIYMIKNILNNKIYIGSAKNFERRCYENIPIEESKKRKSLRIIFN